MNTSKLIRIQIKILNNLFTYLDVSIQIELLFSLKIHCNSFIANFNLSILIQITNPILFNKLPMHNMILEQKRQAI